MNTKSLLFLPFLFICANLQAQTQPKLTIDLSKQGIAISPTHYGVFFEDINHAADGGLYAELIKNRSFEDATTIDPWATITSNALTTLSLDNTNRLNSVQTNSLKMVVSRASTTSRGGVYNPGFWGVNVVDGQQYTLTFFAKRDAAFTGDITASLESSTGVKYAQSVITGLTEGWQKFTFTLTASGSNTAGRFVLSTSANGTVWFDVVSLFPPTFKNRENGLRKDLAQLVVDMKPKFMRFPGGCFVEGDYLANRFQWKNTIGNIENRPGHTNLWGYRTSDGMGYHEFLQFSEDLGAAPLYVVNIGVAHNDFQLYSDVNAYIQDALDALEYANGDVTTTYGAMRAANGHSAPFNIKFIEIGNENNQPSGTSSDHYYDRYIQFYNAIKAKYPTIQCIGDLVAWGNDNPTWGSSHPVQLVDEHYYRSADWFISKYNKYDNMSRAGAKIYVGEYATTVGCGLGNYGAAMGEAVYMIGMEKNSDLVTMNSYAPMFVNVNDRKWTPDLINYNASAFYCTPSYYVQQLFAANLGNVVIPVKDSSIVAGKMINGAVGLGSWLSAVKYKNLSVIKKDGTVLFSDNFQTGSNWTPGAGTWVISATDSAYSQTAETLSDCRSIGQNISDSVYTYSVKAMRTSGKEGFLISFGNKDSKNFYWWNIGGWGNTKHAIEQSVNGAKTTLTSVNGTIVSNQWYDIRIEVSSTKVLCYLDNVLIHTLSTNGQFMYSNATYDSTSKLLYVKVVNTSESAQTTKIDLKGLNINKVNGTVTELSSANLTDENSLVTPTSIAPVVTVIDSCGTLFNYTLKPKSVNIFKLNVSGTTGIVQPNKTSTSMKVYPSFTHDNIYVQNTDEGKYEVNIVDVNGRILIKQNGTGLSKVDLSSQNSGFFFVQIKTGNNVFVQKVIKN